VDFGFSVFGLAYMTSPFFLEIHFTRKKCILPAFFLFPKNAFYPHFFFKDGA